MAVKHRHRIVLLVSSHEAWLSHGVAWRKDFAASRVASAGAIAFRSISSTQSQASLRYSTEFLIKSLRLCMHDFHGRGLVELLLVSRTFAELAVRMYEFQKHGFAECG